MLTRVVAISHATGAAGHSIGHTVADRLGFRYIDEEIIALAAEKEGVDAAVVADTERRKTFLERLFSGLTGSMDPTVLGTGTLVPDTLVAEGSLRTLIIAAILETAEQGNAVIVSHAASIPLAGRPDVLRVLVTASRDTRIARVAEAGGQADPAKFIAENDGARAEYFQRFYHIDHELPTHYDLVINTDALAPDEASDIVVAAAQRRR
jgi:cytidylate kinase-like protein